MTEELLMKYLQSECSDEEFGLVVKWFEDEAHSSSARELVGKIWLQYGADPEHADMLNQPRLLNTIHRQIQITGGRRISMSKRLVVLITRVAAILFIPVLLLYIYTNLADRQTLLSRSPVIMEIKTFPGAISFVELADGSKVWLNQGSKLSYNSGFGTQNRLISLTGEAYFDVAEDSDIPFFVETGTISVKVTGTEFNVMAWPDENTVETTLVEGKLTLFDNSKEIQALAANERLVFNTQTNTYIQNNGDVKKHISWKNGELLFRNDPLEYVVGKLSRWYNVEFVFENDSVGQITFTGSFIDESLSQVLELMEMAMPVNFTVQPRKKDNNDNYLKQTILIRFNNSIQ